VKIIFCKRFKYIKYNKIHCLKKNRYKLFYKYPIFIFQPSYLKEMLNIGISLGNNKMGQAKSKQTIIFI